MSEQDSTDRANMEAFRREASAYPSMQQRNGGALVTGQTEVVFVPVQTGGSNE